jgi:hypothetical protein
MSSQRGCTSGFTPHHPTAATAPEHQSPYAAPEPPTAPNPPPAAAVPLDTHPPPTPHAPTPTSGCTPPWLRSTSLSTLSSRRRSRVTSTHPTAPPSAWVTTLGPTSTWARGWRGASMFGSLHWMPSRPMTATTSTPSPSRWVGGVYCQGSSCCWFGGVKGLDGIARGEGFARGCVVVVGGMCIPRDVWR